MSPFRSDPALYRMMPHGELQGLSGGYVDDLLRTVTTEFETVSKRTHERFDIDEDENLAVTFTGSSQSRNVAESITQDQLFYFKINFFYLKKLEMLEKSASFREFRSMRMKLPWLFNTRPEYLFDISQLAQATKERFNKDKGKTFR